MHVKNVQLPEGLRRFAARLGRLKYAALVLLIGVVLLLWPASEQTGQAETAASASEQTPAETAVEALEQRLSEMLSQLEGAGETAVTLTLQSGARTVYATDLEQRYTDGALTEQTEQTVLYDSGSGQETPLAVQEFYPTFQGALVLCQGADNAAVRLDIINAISGLTGLGADKITVIKMKEQ